MYFDEQTQIFDFTVVNLIKSNTLCTKYSYSYFPPECYRMMKVGFTKYYKLQCPGCYFSTAQEYQKVITSANTYSH